MSIRGLYLLALTSAIPALVVACDSTTPFELADVVGRHTLATVSGQSMPFVLRERKLDASCIRGGVTGDLVERINNGTLVINDDHSFGLTFTVLRICTYPTDLGTNSSSLHTAGTFALAGDRIHLQPTSADWTTMDATRDGGGIAIYLKIPGDHAERRYVFLPFR